MWDDVVLARMMGRGLVAVSGGADSVALLRGLLAQGVAVAVGHFHHQLRAEADQDAEFTRELSSVLGVPFHFGTRYVAEMAGSVENAARTARYDWLTRTAQAEGYAWIATGHTASDQAETVLHNLIRGTGLEGLRGIADVTTLGNVELLRPMLHLTRHDILGYLQDLGQSYCEDASNTDPAFTRNRIRAEVLPLLTTLNPNVVEALSRLSRHADEAVVWLQQAAEEALAQHELPRAGEMVVLSGTSTPVSRVVAIGMLRRIWAREGWPLREMGEAQWQSAWEILIGDRPAWDFPGGVRMQRHRKVVQLFRRS
ncbi:MAG: tRNA lysidine(34) synthetase TilS [Fimbriiglobus sp.]